MLESYPYMTQDMRQREITQLFALHLGSASNGNHDKDKEITHCLLPDVTTHL